jgi:hypothetical protein
MSRDIAFKEFTFNLLPVERKWDFDKIAFIAELIDSGVAYWAFDNCEEARELPLLFVLTESEPDGDAQTFRVDLATIALGINRILSGECELNSDTFGNIAKFVMKNDVAFLDPDDADLIVQAGVYGSIKWG